MALSEEVLIIIIVAALGVALLITVVMAVYFCYCRRRAFSQQQQQYQQEQTVSHNTTTHHHVLPRNDVNEGGHGKMRLDKLPNAAQTKRMEEGQSFSDSHMNGGTTQSDDTPNYIMGPSADLAERQDGGQQNDGFMGENQLDGAAYLRGGVDPADVAEVYMQDDVLQEAAHARRKQQLEVRRKAAASKNNSKKRAAAQRNLQDARKTSGEAHQARDSSRHRSSDKHKNSRT